MSTAPSVSVVVPARNEERFIATALRSIQDQRGEPGLGEFETIVVDDHSTDRTAEVASEFEGVRVVPCEGNGIVDAANTGLRHARASIVARLDADDFYLPGGLLTLVEPLWRDPSLTLVAGGALERFADGTRLPISVPLPTTPHLRIAIMWECPFAHSAVAFRTTRVLELGGYRSQPNGDAAGEDYDLWERILAAGDSVVGIPDPIVERRIRGGSVTTHHREELLRTTASVRGRASARWSQEYSGVATLVGLGRDLRRFPEAPTVSGRFQYVVLRMGVSAAAAGDRRRAVSLAAAASAIGPWSLVRGVVRSKRVHVMDRLGRGRSAWERW